MRCVRWESGGPNVAMIEVGVVKDWASRPSLVETSESVASRRCAEKPALCSARPSRSAKLTASRLPTAGDDTRGGMPGAGTGVGGGVNLGRAAYLH